MESALLSTIPGSLTELGNLKHLGAVLIELEFETRCVTAAFQNIWDGRKLIRLLGNGVYSARVRTGSG